MTRGTPAPVANVCSIPVLLSNPCQFRGKPQERARARKLRGQGQTLAQIAETLGVSKSSVSIWVRDVSSTPVPRRTDGPRRPHPQHLARLQQIAELDDAGRERLGVLSEQAFLAAGIALYAGEGGKRDGSVLLANTDPAIIAFFCAWLRHFYAVDEGCLRVRVYLHEGRDLLLAQNFWAGLTGVPLRQFGASFRALPDPSRSGARHEHGCAYVIYNCARTHRSIMGLVRALLSSGASFRGSSIGGAVAC